MTGIELLTRTRDERAALVPLTLLVLLWARKRGGSNLPWGLAAAELAPRVGGALAHDAVTLAKAVYEGRAGP